MDIADHILLKHSTGGSDSPLPDLDLADLVKRSAKWHQHQSFIKMKCADKSNDDWCATRAERFQEETKRHFAQAEHHAVVSDALWYSYNHLKNGHGGGKHLQ